MPEGLPQFGGAKDRPEAALLLACARTRVTPEIADRIRSLVQEEVDWIALIRLAMRHDVMSLLYRNLQQVCPKVPILVPLRARYEAQATHANQNVQALLQILPLLEDHGIRAVPYKGPALAQSVYGDLSLRPFGDLDISILERDVLKAQDLIRCLGYEVVSEMETDDLAEHIRTSPDCELQLKRSDGVLVELHWRFARRSAHIAQDPKPFLQRFETIELGGKPLRSLSLEAYFMVLSMHATKHKWGQLKLICDIAEILGKSHVDWNDVTRQANTLGLRRMLAVGTLLAEDPLGAVVPKELARGLRIDQTARSVAAHIRSGLFEEPDGYWHEPADLLFLRDIRERWRDRAALRCEELSDRIRPSDRDRRFVSLPESLSSLYYLLRPVRWAWEKMDAQNSGQPAREALDNALAHPRQAHRNS